MLSLRDDMDTLVELNAVRDEARSLLDQARNALEHYDGKRPWVNLDSTLEAALLVRVHTIHEGTDEARERSFATFYERAQGLSLYALFPDPDEDDDIGRPIDRRIPVVVSAISLEVLASRSKTVLSAEAMRFYFRVIHDLTLVTPPDWTLGGGRSGPGGNVSAFVTNESVRAVMVFSKAFTHTVAFLERTRELCDQFTILKGLQLAIGKASPRDPMLRWIEKAAQRMWFDWHLSTARARERTAFDVSGQLSAVASTIDIENYFLGLTKLLYEATSSAARQIDAAREELRTFEASPPAHFQRYDIRPSRQYEHKRGALEFAKGVLDVAYKEALDAAGRCKQDLDACSDSKVFDAALGERIQRLLTSLSRQFSRVRRDIHRVVDPTRHYAESVLDKELANAASKQFDPGDLAFAAASYGYLTRWTQRRGRLAEACELLSTHLPSSGLLTTKRPYHTTRRGYKLFPTACEMTRSLAALFEHIDYPFAPAVARRLLRAVQEKAIFIEDPPLVGWNFEGSSDLERPSVWVTAVTLLALERLIRMLDRRINAIVLQNFTVVQPANAQNKITLNDLIYPDYGFAEYYPRDDRRVSTGIRLEQMRAHLLGITPPSEWDIKGSKRIVSAVLYGPPGTGKSTLAEALAASSKVPVVMLSPFDLRTGSDETVEGNTRLVFNALTMLTNAVILFDEFESAVQRRNDVNRMVSAEDAKKPRVPESNDSLLTGLLPHLARLHDAAKRQGLAYFMATNDFRGVDEAAIRRGRFDAWLPVYHPDPLSRAGTLLFRLQKLHANGQIDFQLDSHAAWRVLQVVAATPHSASLLAEADYRLPDGAAAGGPKLPTDVLVAAFRHVLRGGVIEFDRKIEVELDADELYWFRYDGSKLQSWAWENEMLERAWLVSAERDLASTLARGDSESQGTVTDTLRALIPGRRA